MIITAKATLWRGFGGRKSNFTWKIWYGIDCGRPGELERVYI